MQILTLANETLTDTIYRIFKTLPVGVYETTLANNPHLLDLPLKLPANTPVKININLMVSKEKATINLWD